MSFLKKIFNSSKKNKQTTRRLTDEQVESYQDENTDMIMQHDVQYEYGGEMYNIGVPLSPKGINGETLSPRSVNGDNNTMEEKFTEKNSFPKEPS